MFSILSARRMLLTLVALAASGGMVIAATSTIDGSATREGSATTTESETTTVTPNTTTAESAYGKSLRIREGTTVTDLNGYFREDGDGASFVADTGFQFGALPNLNLERVVRLLKAAEEPTSIRWSVTGKVTEFSGRNYLLINRAVYKAAAPPPVPGRIAQ